MRGTFFLSEFELASCTKTMAKRMQEQERRKDRGKVKADDELGLTYLDKFFHCEQSDCVEKPGQHLVEEWSSTGKFVATEGGQEHLNFSEDSTSTRRLVASGNSEIEGKDEIWQDHLQTSKDGSPHLEKVFSIVRQRYGLSPRDEMKGLDVNAAIWRILCLTLFKLQNILAQTFRRIWDLPRINPRNHSNSCFKWLRSWSLTKLKSLELQRSIGGSLCGERRLCWLTELFSLKLQKTYVLSDSVLCLGGISDEPVGSWESRTTRFLETRYLKDVDRIEWEPMEFEAKNFEGFTTLGSPHEIQKTMTKSKCEPEQFQGRIIFISIYNDIDWGKTRKQRKLYCECSQSYWVCSKIHARTLVISGAWIGEDMVRNPSPQARWRMG